MPLKWSLGLVTGRPNLMVKVPKPFENAPILSVTLAVVVPVMCSELVLRGTGLNMAAVGVATAGPLKSALLARPIPTGLPLVLAKPTVSPDG